jgi:hypothetical protein
MPALAFGAFELLDTKPVGGRTLGQLASFIQQRIRHVYRRQRARPLPSCTGRRVVPNRSSGFRVTVAPNRGRLNSSTVGRLTPGSPDPDRWTVIHPVQWPGSGQTGRPPAGRLLLVTKSGRTPENDHEIACQRCYRSRLRLGSSIGQRRPEPVRHPAEPVREPHLQLPRDNSSRRPGSECRA